MLPALAGGVAGLLLSLWAVRTFGVLAANQLPRAASIEMDGRVLAFAGAVTFTVGIFCGLWPLFLLRTRQLASAVREGDMRTASGGGRSLGNGLVVAEIAIAFAMLVGAGLLVKNLLLLQGRDAGVRTERIVAFDIAPAGPRYKAPEQLISFYRELQGRLAQIDLIEGVGMTSHLPMYNFGYNGEMTIEGGNPWGAGENPLVEYRWIDPALPIARVQTLEQVVAGSIGQPRLMSALTGLFGGLAGLLAMVGVYGVMAYNVRRQRREFGIRLALGAAQRDVRALVVGRGLILGIAGVAVGAFGAWLLTGLLRTLLHDVKPTDPAIFAGMAAAVLVVTTLASYLPARAAGRVDPMVVLRDN